MSELTDDQLDGLFRKSAEEFDPPFDPAAWQDMKARLDAKDGPTPAGTPLWKNILRWGLPIGVLVLMMFGSVYTYRHVMGGRDSTSVLAITFPIDLRAAKTLPERQAASARSRSTETRSTDTAPALSANTDVSAQPIEKDDRSAVLEKPADGVARHTPDIDPGVNNRPHASREAGERNTTEVTRATNGAVKTYPLKTDPSDVAGLTSARNRTLAPERSGSGSATGRKLTTPAGQPTTDRFVRNKRRKATRMATLEALVAMNDGAPLRASSRQQPINKTAGVSQNSTTNSVESMTQTDLAKTEAVSPLTINELAIRPARWPNALPFKGRELVVQPDTISQRVKPTPPVERGMSIRFAISPDLSSVGLRNFSRPGTNVGVLLEYRIASRWSLQAGVIQSTKVYEAYPSDYKAPSGSYVDMVGSKVGSIDARCNMFDIPINLRYDFVLRPRNSGLSPSRWFINSGVTSYYIKQEDYVYNYTGYVHNAVPAWSTKTGGYGFSQLNLSVGYERALTKRLSWQVEPFMKMPLKGVGFFKINLLSTGTFFSLRYKL